MGTAHSVKGNSHSITDDIRITKQGGGLDSDQATEPEEQSLSPLFKPQPLAVVFHNYATDAFADVRTRGQVDEISRRTVTVGDLTITTEDNFASRIGVGEDKILQAAIAAFTRANGRHKPNPTLRVFIDLPYYEKLNGIETVPRHMGTPEEQERENQRIEEGRRNFYRKLSHNLENLSTCSFSWTETKKRRNKDGKYERRTEECGGGKLIGTWQIRRDKHIMIEFVLSAAERLVHRPTTNYPTALFKVDERNPNAYSIGREMARHYSMYNNVAKGTEQYLSVATLLQHTNLPPIEKVRAQRKGWEQAIKEPFENALDELKRAGVLKEWSYSLPRGESLSEEQAYSIDSYEKFVSLLVYHEIDGYEPHLDRYLQLMEKREAAAENGVTKEKTPAKAKAKAPSKRTSKSRNPGKE